MPGTFILGVGYVKGRPGRIIEDVVVILSQHNKVRLMNPIVQWRVLLVVTIEAAVTRQSTIGSKCEKKLGSRCGTKPSY